jgi:hypothetical protein
MAATREEIIGSLASLRDNFWTAAGAIRMTARAFRATDKAVTAAGDVYQRIDEFGKAVAEAFADMAESCKPLVAADRAWRKLCGADRQREQIEAAKERRTRPTRCRPDATPPDCPADRVVRVAHRVLPRRNRARSRPGRKMAARISAR